MPTQHLRKAFDYNVDIFNLHMEVSATYGYMGSQEIQSLKLIFHSMNAFSFLPHFSLKI